MAPVQVVGVVNGTGRRRHFDYVHEHSNLYSLEYVRCASSFAVGVEVEDIDLEVHNHLHPELK